jgi:hypothetical protein
MIATRTSALALVMRGGLASAFGPASTDNSFLVWSIGRLLSDDYHDLAELIVRFYIAARPDSLSRGERRGDDRIESRVG